jgi:cellulose biosynthesis protein BcsQ
MWSQNGKRVLLVDLDYQGSLTHLARYQTGDQTPVLRAAVSHWLQEQRVDFPETIAKITKDLHYVSCGYAFETLERQLEYSWILGYEKTDVRYRLAAVLQSSFIQQSYDCIILDAPPRLTTGFINGFAAATHLYVPTVVDRLSVTAVRNFASVFSKLQPQVNPALRFAGVIGTMTTVTWLANAAREFAAQVDMQLQRSLNSCNHYFIRDAVIKRDANITYCSGIAYLKNEKVREMFDRLGELMESQVFMRKPNGRSGHIASPARAEQADLELR